MVVPLFIFAATICRFLKDRRLDKPIKQLATILEYQARSQTFKLEATYLPVLNRLINQLSTSETKKMLSKFRRIIGPVVLLTEPLPMSSLSTLL